MMTRFVTTVFACLPGADTAVAEGLPSARHWVTERILIPVPTSMRPLTDFSSTRPVSKAPSRQVCRDQRFAIHYASCYLSMGLD